MGLDIYAGTLTRYYSGNWKTKTQQFAEENGIKYESVRPVDTEEEEVSPEEICGAVSSWRDEVVSGLSQVLGEPVCSWEEDNYKPYRTDKPDWDAFGALVICSAAIHLGKPAPKSVEKNWRWYEHPLLAEAQESDETGGSLVSGVELWLPVEQVITFDYPDPCGDDSRIGTVEGLICELANINQEMWGAQLEEVKGWRETEGYPADFEIVDGKPAAVGKPCEVYDLDSLAKFAFSIFYDLADFAGKSGVPVKLDY